MATTFVDYTGDGNATKSFSFPSIKEADIKVDVDGVIKTSGNHYNITSYTTTGGGNVVFTSGNIPASPAAIRIFRDTDVDAAKATFVAGSSVKAGDLNNNMTQILYAAQEEQNQTVLTSDIKDAAITTAKIKDAKIRSLFAKAIGEENVELDLNKLARDPRIIASLEERDNDIKSGNRGEYDNKDYYHNRVIGQLMTQIRKKAWSKISGTRIVQAVIQEQLLADQAQRQKQIDTGKLLSMYK